MKEVGFPGLYGFQELDLRHAAFVRLERRVTYLFLYHQLLHFFYIFFVIGYLQKLVCWVLVPLKLDVENLEKVLGFLRLVVENLVALCEHQNFIEGMVNLRRGLMDCSDEGHASFCFLLQELANL